MATDATELRVGVTGHLYVAPVGTTLPTDILDSLSSWTDLGLISEDGPSVTAAQDVTDIKVWQFRYPGRRVKTGESFEIGVSLGQTNAAVLKLAFGGGTVTSTANGVKYSPPSAAQVDERSFILEVDDGTIKDWYVIERGFSVLSGDIAFKKDDVTWFPLTIAATATASDTLPWFMLSSNTDIVAG